MASYFLFVLVGILSLLGILGAADEWGNSTPAFYKIYVSPNEIISTPSGTFYVTPEGEREPVRMVSQDSEGTYVILITQYCPSCGRAYSGKVCSEGYSCPLYQIQSFPHIWCDH